MRTVVAVLLLLPALALAQVPDRIGYQGRLLKSDGTPESGSVKLTFTMFGAATGGTSLWTEDQTLAPVDGFYSVQLGDVTAFPANLFDGSPRFLEIAVNNTPLSPRQKVASVPYALVARSVIGGAVNATSVTVAGKTIIDATGKLTADAYSAGAGIAISGNKISLLTSCASNDVLRWNGTDWACAASSSGGSYTAGTGLELNGTTFSLVKSCQNGQVLQWNANAWGCATVASGSVSATAPLANNAGTLSITRASALADGYLAKEDFAAFAAKPSITSGNLIDWQSDVTRWKVARAGDLAATVSLNTTDVLEGDSSFDLNITSGATGSNMVYGNKIPVDPSMRYVGRISAKLVNGAGTFYAGYVAYDKAGAVLAGNGGTFGYFIASGVTLTANWQTFSGSIQGEGTANNTFPVGTRFIQPLVITNYQNIGTVRIDSFEIRRDTNRAIARWQGTGANDQQDNGNLSGRTVTFNKVSASSGLRVVWSDNFRISTNGYACRWEVLFNGARCTNPGSLSFDKYEGATSSNRHDPATVVGTCFGIAAGQVTVSTRVGPTPGYNVGDCYTGWNGQLVSLEVEEVD